MHDITELSDEAAIIEEVAVRLTVVRDELDKQQQELLASAASSLHAVAALLRSLGFSKRKRLMKAKAGK
jgi:hypothetical protein